MPAGAPAAPAVLASLDAGWAAQGSWTILDTGFGCGSRFLSIWQHWQTHASQPALLHYVGLLSAAEATDLADALRRNANGPSQTLPDQLAGLCYGLNPGFHRILLEQGRLSLTLCVGEREALLAQQALRADTLLAGAPAQVWDKWQIKSLARCCRRGTQLFFPQAALPAPALLGEAGFESAAMPGAANAPVTYNPRWQLRASRRDAGQLGHTPGRCAVIGAGIAGASVARALALRGWQVDVYDRQAGGAGGASGLPIGLVVPHHSADDSPRSRMSRNGTRLMLQHARELLRLGQDWNPGGVLELSVDEAGLAEEEAELLSQASPRAADSDWASPKAYGGRPGLWHPHAAWIKPAPLVQAWLAHGRIRFHGHAEVHTLQRQAPQWLLCAADGSELGRADRVVFANAHGSAALLQGLAGTLPGDFPWVADVLGKLKAMQPMLGSLSMGLCPSPREMTDFPPYPVNGHGSFVSGVPTPQGRSWYAGSTFRSDASQHAKLPQEHAANLRKLEALLPAVARCLAPQFTEGRVQAWQGTRCVTHDRLPLVGPLEAVDAPTLWLCAGMGARGLSFSALCAELLVAELGGEPLPIESSLAKALGTGRLRRARRGS